MIIVPAKIEKIIRADGERAYPNECCGVLIGTIDGDGTKFVHQAEAIENAREDGAQHNRFLITPEDLMRAEKSARTSKLDVIGFYHSHPDHVAEPSQYDKDHALPFYSYIIVSVNKGRAEKMLSWELTNDRSEFKPETLLKEVQ